MVGPAGAVEHEAIRYPEAIMNSPLPPRLFSRRSAPLEMAPAPSSLRALASLSPQGLGRAAHLPLPDPRQELEEGSTAFLGWFDSSRELREGLHVIEHAGLPAGLGHGLR